MKYISTWVFSALFLVLISGCKLDNYKSPNAGIKGKLIDSFTQKPIKTVQPNGFRIRLLDQSYKNPKPLDFWGKADGTYKNSKIFSGKYKVIPINGAFFRPRSKVININSMKTVNFTVTPFLELTNVSVTPIVEGAIVKYRIKKASTSGKIITSQSLASQYPSVSHTVFSQVVYNNNLSNVPDEDIKNTQFADTLSGLTSGKKYYIRAAAQAKNSENRYNYSKTFSIDVK